MSIVAKGSTISATAELLFSVAEDLGKLKRGRVAVVSVKALPVFSC